MCWNTVSLSLLNARINAAAFGRLCVETKISFANSPNEPAAAFGRLCVETLYRLILLQPLVKAAAFGRLCVETLSIEYLKPYLEQPPSGGCVLKPCLLFRKNNRTFAAAFGRLCVETTLNGCSFGYISAAAFGRLCVETSRRWLFYQTAERQPPSGGCVLKHSSRFPQSCGSDAAAFGRLCVETPIKSAAIYSRRKAAAFGRLCVETLITHHLINVEVAAAFGRLCVETNY